MAPLEPRTKDFARKTFGASDRVVLRALGEAMFSEDGDVAPARLDELVSDVEGFVSAASRNLRFALVAMIKFIRFSPILLFHSLSLFEDLPVGKRVAVLDKMDKSSVGLVALVLVAYRTLLTMVFYEQPAELRLLGYPGDVRKTYKRLPSAPRAREHPKPSYAMRAAAAIEEDVDDAPANEPASGTTTGAKSEEHA